MNRWLSWVVLGLVALALSGCGQRDTKPVEKTDPLPRERFPRADK